MMFTIVFPDVTNLNWMRQIRSINLNKFFNAFECMTGTIGLESKNLGANVPQKLNELNLCAVNTAFSQRWMCDGNLCKTLKPKCSRTKTDNDEKQTSIDLCCCRVRHVHLHFHFECGSFCVNTTVITLKVF